MALVPAFWRRALLTGLGIAAVNLALIPLAPGGEAVPPDLLYCLIVAWALRDPASVTLWIVLPLALLADVMLSRPPGLGALGLVLAAETARAHAAQLRNLPFLLEWLLAVAGFALILAGIQFALRITFADAPGLEAHARYLMATALSYPVVALAIGWGMRLRPVRETTP